MAKTREERLSIFLQRLNEAPLAGSWEEAWSQVETTLNAVEDEFSGIPFDPPTLGTDGRMYPPKDDYTAPLDGFPEVTKSRTKGDDVFIRTNGAIQIKRRRAEVLLDKPGKDGRRVFDDETKP